MGDELRRWFDMAIIEGQKVKVKWVGANRKQMELHGHVYTKLYEEIEIPIEHLSDNSHELVKAKCDWCDKTIDKQYGNLIKYPNHFCNAKCRGEWEKSTGQAKLRNAHRRTSIETNCKICDKKITKKPAEFKGHGKHYCSRSCLGKDKLVNNNPNPKKDKLTVNCEQCGNHFEVHESKKRNNKWIFCSRQCYADYRSENLYGDKVHNYKGLTTNCENCDIEIKTTQNQLDKSQHQFCSQECYWEFRGKYYVGENHPHFGTTKTPEQIDKMRIVTASRIANGDVPQTNTSIQIKTRTIVEELSLPFKEEIQFKYYVLDFYDEINNLAIEVMGDYWHANPNKYNVYELLHDIQKKDVRRDKSKNTYLKKYHDINILYLWEKDINVNPELCKEIIKTYVDNKGVLEEYNSYNYCLTDGTLDLNKEIILPYFMRSNTINQIGKVI